jgi:D-alanyl-D-alanine carboxypeptidase
MVSIGRGLRLCGGVLIALVLVLPSALAQTVNDPNLLAVAEQARTTLESPAVAVMQMRDGEVRIAASGLRDAGDTIEVSPDDLWHIGSNTKSMTATLVARLAEQGVVSWDDTVAEHLGDAIAEIDPGFADVTFRHLLSHRSGASANIGMFHMLRFQVEGVGGRPIPEQRLDYAGHILSQTPNSEPGTEFSYSNAGYVIAGAMLEQATGESWETLVMREVFVPLGIDDVGFGAPGSVSEIDQPRGHGSGMFGGLSSRTGAQADNPPVLGPAGTVHIALADYALYLQVHIDGARGEDTSFLSVESWRMLHTPPFEGRYAMGWLVGEDELNHAGSNTLWVLQAVIVPEQNLGAVVAVNRVARTSLGPILMETVEAE